MRLLLDHSIVGQSATTLTIRKDRNLAACRICGDIFQPSYYIDAVTLDDETAVYDAETQIMDWRRRHNSKHTNAEHLNLASSGLTFTPEAAHKLAPFGLVPIQDTEVGEIVDALREAPRAPVDDVETTLKGWR